MVNLRVGRLWSLCWIRTFLVKLYNTWKKKETELTKTKTRYLAIILTHVSFVSRVNKQGNFITAPAEFDVTFDFVIYLCSRRTIKKLNVAKIAYMFFADRSFLYSRFKTSVVFMSQILLLMAKYFILDWPSWKLPSALPKNCVQEPISRSLPPPYKPYESTFARIFLF